jgi:hypothetical protein
MKGMAYVMIASYILIVILMIIFMGRGAVIAM